VKMKASLVFRVVASFCLCSLVSAIRSPIDVNSNSYSPRLLADISSTYGLSDTDSVVFAKLMEARLVELRESGELLNWNQVRGAPPKCPTLPTPPPAQNISTLRPGNVGVVDAMGDSISAAFGAESTSLINLDEFRGVSWSIGGDANDMTMPNMLKQFSPTLYGFSTGIGKRDMPTNFLNGAVSGAIVQDMPDQADWLIGKLQALGDDVWRNQWKVVTIWIGGNNLCDVCSNLEENSPDVYEDFLVRALTKLRTIPRLFVNLVPSLDITQLHDFETGLCRFLHVFECRCATGTDAQRQAVLDAQNEYANRIFKIGNDTQWRTNDFAVVVQPFLINSRIPDQTYLSAADCFHPSVKGHEAAGVALWNGMLEPVAQKRWDWEPGEQADCPNANSIFYVD